MRLVLLIILSLLLNSCEVKTTSNNDGPTTPPPAGDRTFWVLDLTKDNQQLSSYYQVSAKLLYTNEKVNMYVDVNKIDRVDSNSAVSLGDEFRDLIHPTTTSIYGAESDFDNNNKVNILFIDIIDGGTANSYTAGFFYSADLFASSETVPLGIRSNESEMLYVDCQQATVSTTNTNLKSTIAHEFQHLIGFNQRFFIRNRAGQLSGWINEGIAEAASFEVYGNPAIYDRFDWMQSNGFDKSASLEYWPSNSSGSGSDYALSATYFNYVSNEFATSNERQSFLAAIQNDVNGDYNAVTAHLEDYSGTAIEKLKKSFYNYVSRGLVRVTTDAFPGISSANFNGINFSDGPNHSDRGFVPRVFKYNTNSAVTMTGTQFKLFDVSDTIYTENMTIGSLNELDNTGYSVALVFSDNTTDDFFNYSVTTPLAAKNKKFIKMPNNPARVDASFHFRLKK